MGKREYLEKIKELSSILSGIQRTIIILDSLSWTPRMRQFFRESNYKEIPALDYDDRPLKYNPLRKIQDLVEFREYAVKSLGQDDPIGKILVRNALEYEDVIKMLMNRGRKEFYQYSKKLYGSANETIPSLGIRLVDGAEHIYSQFISSEAVNYDEVRTEKRFTAKDVCDEMGTRLKSYFHQDEIRLILSRKIASDASAGSDYIKIKDGGLFSEKEIDILTVHEGHVHLASNLNSQKQEYCKWFDKGPPSATLSQEGLAIFMEFYSGAMCSVRMNKIMTRLKVSQMVESGANVIDVLEFYRTMGLDEAQALSSSERVFRGASLKGGEAFTKDISYLKGFIQIHEYLQTNSFHSSMEEVPFLFSGKVSIEDLKVMKKLNDEEMLVKPYYLPELFKNINQLKATLHGRDYFENIRAVSQQPHKKIA